MLQTIGNSLQLLGAGITGAGLFHAWNRASHKFDEWRNTMWRGFGDLNAFSRQAGEPHSGGPRRTRPCRWG